MRAHCKEVDAKAEFRMNQTLDHTFKIVMVLCFGRGRGILLHIQRPQYSNSSSRTRSAKLGYSGGEEEYDGRNDRGKTHIVGLWHVV